MYSIYSKDYDNVFDLLKYTISSMKETGYDEMDVHEFIANAIKGSNYELISLSQEKLSECNIINRNLDPDVFPWQEYADKYSLLNSDDAFDLEEDDNVTDLCDDLNSHRYYWENDIDDQEAYEGFDSCKNYCYKWDDKDDLCYDYLTKDEDDYGL